MSVKNLAGLVIPCGQMQRTQKRKAQQEHQHQEQHGARTATKGTSPSCGGRRWFEPNPNNENKRALPKIWQVREGGAEDNKDSPTPSRNWTTQRLNQFRQQVFKSYGYFLKFRNCSEPAYHQVVFQLDRWCGFLSCCWRWGLISNEISSFTGSVGKLLGFVVENDRRHS